ncbi:DNA-binding LacI/PurR family transcriptional regulator [Leptothrix sp. C29]|uniref:DNA-binding LacI/PurR family transcriptional regulator n=1 Tax=Sphaerotilus uruguayifluvii TaxID=2735897 RepID=A0ABX2FYL8_9BURK|nr:DNA-binding LacI/PurR family transcriptional regulator [Leptothrix sp. C29]
MNAAPDPAPDDDTDRFRHAAAEVGLRDIALAAGVSIGTVSRALKNQRGLSDETRRQVREIAHRLGYDHDRLRRRQARRLVFLIHRHHDERPAHPFYAEVLQGAEQVCRERGLVLALLSAGPADPLRDWLRMHEPDLLVAAGHFEPELVALLRRLELPLALVDDRQGDCRAVHADDADGGRQATRHLLALGRRRIAFLGGPPAHHSIRERERGHRRALFEAGLPADPALGVSAPAGLDTRRGAEAAMRELLRLRERPDAVFAYNDAAAIAAMRVCLAAGLRVPQDIAFVGFDDIADAAAAPVPLTTVRVDKTELGRLGVELALDSAQAPRLPQHIVLPVQLVCRASTDPETGATSGSSDAAAQSPLPPPTPRSARTR